MFDLISDLVKFVAIVIAIIFGVIATPIVVSHIVEHWDAPQYPHSGFSPECPTWTAPEE